MSSADVDFVEKIVRKPLLLKDMPGIQSQVIFGVGGGGATISVGPVDAESTKVEVTWGTGGSSTLVYSATTPNLPGQSSIPAAVVTSSIYVLKLKIWYSAWTRPDVYTGSFTAAPGTIVVLVLNPAAPGGP